jgi:predicted RNase H-like HicB family nuclease
MRRYVGVIHKEPTSDYGVSFPDLPGCVTAGKTMAIARRMAAEALAVHLEGMAVGGDPIPVPRDLQAIRNDPECAGATTLILVEVPAKAIERVL